MTFTFDLPVTVTIHGLEVPKEQLQAAILAYFDSRDNDEGFLRGEILRDLEDVVRISVRDVLLTLCLRKFEEDPALVATGSVARSAIEERDSWMRSLQGIEVEIFPLDKP